MKVLVTGATGFIGSHVINKLLHDKHQVIATSTDVSKAQQFDWYNKVKFVEYSLNQFEESFNLFSFFETPDILIHLAWQGLPNYKASFHIDKNLFPQFLFLKNLIENGLKSLTITGTCFEYGMRSGCLQEDFLAEPSNYYALAKDCLRRFLDEMQKEHSFSFKWIRLFYMYGKGQNSKSLIPLLEKAIKNNDNEFNMSGGEQIRDYLTVEEVAQNIILTSLQNRVTGIINCCSGKPVSVKEFVKNFIVEKNSNIKLNLGYYPYPDYEPMEFWGNKNKLNKILDSI